ncbi:putative G-protein coupled receptor K01A12.3 [Toxocara canis]|uniref:Putative G-protein coupled receptor K01A12.3 n=1 Tax=Toxocara canis TaxID=6265 RepID=A0A0B2VYX1_TOXCA|nr:putative G-protein coupled receptor K01A12.3 [Toxocara canis]
MTVLSFRFVNAAAFITIASLFNFVSVVAQWLCSALVLIKIRQVRKKINKNKLNVNSANRFRKQARLTFQFFYPSLICTVSSVVYFTKPFMADLLTEWQFVLLHTVWLCNHMCNPFIYAYFNERMRTSYRNWLTCARLRCIIRKKRKQHGFVGRRRHNVSTRSFGAGARSNRMSTRSARTTRDGNFVRNSLQMQSRDFEQLCEFMVRVNPLYDSSEGWRESSDEEEEQPEVEVRAACSDNQALQEPRSVVLDLGRQTVEHWARFAKKASI